MPTIIHKINTQPGAPFPWQQKPSRWQEFRRDPARFIVRWLYNYRAPVQPASPPSTQQPPISLVCISDTHNTQPAAVPPGDILLHAGDLTSKGTVAELQAQLDWLNSLPHRHKLVIAGNHDVVLDAAYARRHPDRCVEGAAADLDWGDVVYLENSPVSLLLRGGSRLVKIYGSPWTEMFGTWAFQYPPIRDVWSGTVPEETEVLLVHGPPRGFLDCGGKGCPMLLREIGRVRPRVVVFGHIHAGFGREDVRLGDWMVQMYCKAMMSGTGPVRFWRGCGMVVGAFAGLVRDWARHWFVGRGEADVIMVNAAMMGSRDGECREPFVVWI